MTADQIASLADGAILAGGGLLLILSRTRISRRISDPAKKKHTDSIVVGIGPLLVLFGLLSCVWQYSQFETALEAAARELNAKAPYMVADGLRFDGASVYPANKLTYIFTFVGIATDEFDRSGWNANQKPQTEKAMLEIPVIQQFLKQGIAVSYRFKSSDRTILDHVDLLPDETRSE